MPLHPTSPVKQTNKKLHASFSKLQSLLPHHELSVLFNLTLIYTYAIYMHVHIATIPIVMACKTERKE